MKKFCICLVLLLLLAACGGGGEAYNGDADQQNQGIQRTGGGDTIFDIYVYLPEFSPLAHITERIHATHMHEGRIYFAYAIEGLIVIESILPDGTSISQTEVPTEGTFIDIAGLHITEDGYFALIFAETEWAEEGGGEVAVFYAEFSPQGAEIARRELPWRAHPNAIQSHFTQALFIEDGGLVLVVETWSGDDFFRTVHLFDAELALLGQLDAQHPIRPLPMAETRDGRVIIADMEPCPITHSRPALREIDLEAGDWGETILIPAGLQTVNIHSLYPAREGDPFDLYIVEGSNLLGFHLEDRTKTRILDWMESQLSTRGEFHLHFLDTGQLSVIIGEQRGDDWQFEHALLTRTPRADLPEREVITVGGFGVSHSEAGGLVHELAMEFSRRSQTHRIEIEDFMPGAGADEAAWEAALNRFHMDIMTGQGPDIIFSWMNDWLPNMVDAGILLDLYPFIDADPELNRSDFLPNILALAETEDGTLPVLPYAFTIWTLTALSDVLEGFDAWTFAEMRSLVEQAVEADMPNIMTNATGIELPAFTMLNMALFTSDFGFIDLTENTANLDNAHFIEILELAAHMPEDITWNFDFDIRNLARRMRDGEWILHEAVISSIGSFQMHREIYGDDIVFIGWPSQEGSGHQMQPRGSFSIPVSNPDPDAAWGFIREFLMPGLELDPWFGDWVISLSVRADELDAVIEDAMTPRFERDQDGNEVEVPRMEYFVGTPEFWDLYAMTEAQAQEFRALVEGVNLRNYQIDAIFYIIAEEWMPFIHGDRSAEDTARIMQNRVQTFLWERG